MDGYDVVVVDRSKSFILTAFEDGAAQGAIRADLDPEILMVLFMGTVHALIGMQGIHKLATGDLDEKPERVLDALKALIESPGTGASMIRPEHLRDEHDQGELI
jgi:hypothetical protein